VVELEKRPDDKQPDVVEEEEAMGNQTGPVNQWRNALGGVTDQLNQLTGKAYNFLTSYTAVTAKAIAAGGATSRKKTNRRMRPSETIDDDVSTASVFVVTILLMLIETLAIFFAISAFVSVIRPSRIAIKKNSCAVSYINGNRKRQEISQASVKSPGRGGRAFHISSRCQSGRYRTLWLFSRFAALYVNG
jgi:hypothetical protein